MHSPHLLHALYVYDYCRHYHAYLSRLFFTAIYLTPIYQTYLSQLSIRVICHTDGTHCSWEWIDPSTKKLPLTNHAICRAYFYSNCELGAPVFVFFFHA